MSVELIQRERGVEFRVKASPGSRKNEIRGVFNGALKVCVTSVAEKGKANQAIVKLLARKLGYAKSQIELTSGSTSPLKKFLVLGTELATLEEAMAKLLGD